MREEGRNRGPPSAPQRFRKVQHRQAINQSINQSINQCMRRHEMISSFCISQSVPI